MHGLTTLCTFVNDGSLGAFSSRHQPPIITHRLTFVRCLCRFDAESTWELRNVLHEKLSSRYWVQEKTMYDFYMTYFVPYAQVLTDMERAGILVDVQTILPAAEALAKQERMDAEKHFMYDLTERGSWSGILWGRRSVV